MRVRCTTCFRTERWTDDEHEVLVEGGSRQPRAHPLISSFHAFKRSFLGEIGPIVGFCSACGQPLEGEPGMPAVPHTLQTEAGPLFLSAERIEGPDGPLSLSDARLFLEAQYGALEPLRPGQAVFSAFLLTFMTVPVLLWATAVLVVIVFLSMYSNDLPVYVPD